MAQTLPAIAPSFSPQMTVQPRVRTVTFGDSYELRMPDGLNPIKHEVQVPWNTLSASDATTLLNFFEGLGGVNWFWWQPPAYPSQKKYVCTKWTCEPVQDLADHFKILADFHEVFDLTG